MNYLEIKGFEFDINSNGELIVMYGRNEKTFNQDDIEMLMFFLNQNFKNRSEE